MGWSLANNTDFSGYQIEIAFLLSLFIIVAIWIYYDSDRYFPGPIKHVFWVLTIISGPIGLIIYLIIRRNRDY